MGNEAHRIKGILLGWKEVRIGDDYSETLLKLQVLTNLIQATAEGKIQRQENASEQEPRRTENNSIGSNRQED